MEQKNVTICNQELVIDIDELKDNSLVIYRLQWWKLILGKVIIHKSRSGARHNWKCFLAYSKFKIFFLNL